VRCLSCALVYQTNSRGKEIRHFFARIAAETIVSSYSQSRTQPGGYTDLDNGVLYVLYSSILAMIIKYGLFVLPDGGSKETGIP